SLTMSSATWTWLFFRSAAPRAVMEIPTSSRRCSRFCAVTTISCKSSARTEAETSAAIAATITTTDIRLIMLSLRLMTAISWEGSSRYRCKHCVRECLGDTSVVGRSNRGSETVVVGTKEYRLGVRVIQKAFSARMAAHPTPAYTSKRQPGIGSLETEDIHSRA